MKVFNVLIQSIILLSIVNKLLGQGCPPSGAIGGKIYVDYNYNGLNDDAGGYIPTVKVAAYNAQGTKLEETLSDRSGQYTLAIANGEAVRIEFTDLPQGYTDGTIGNQSRSSVRIVTSPNCNIDFGIAVADCLCQNDPPLIVPCYVNGDPLSGSVGSQDALVMVGYDQRGNGANYATLPPTAGNGGMPTPLAKAAQVGAVWGVAWDQKSKTAFTTSVVKRFSGFGPLGVAGIYAITDPAGSRTVSSYLNLAPCLSLPALNRPGLALDIFGLSFDIEAYNAAGKQGLGGVTVSDDDMFLYTVDLSNKRLVQVKLRNSPEGPLLPGSCSNVNTYQIPNIPGCVNIDNRPWAVKEHKGKVYVGVVCSAETSGNRSDMKTQIFVFDPVTQQWGEVFDNPPSLDYTTKGCAVGMAPLDQGLCCEWNTWLRPNEYLYSGVNPQGFICNSQPILSDLEFDADGSIILGFMDRFGLQIGWSNGHDPASTSNFSGMAGGDILYAYNDRIANRFIFNSGQNILDANGNIVKTGCGIGGQFGTEFYCADNVAANHTEGFHGGLALHKKGNNLIGTFVDPGLALGSGQVNAGGILHVDNSGGFTKDYFAVYYNGGPQTYGKAVGVGDITMMCDIPPIQIGNFVWEDENKNGIQDPSEPPISGIGIDLYNDTGSVIASTTTDANGYYYFSSITTPTLIENSNYTIVISDYTNSNGLSGTGLVLTQSNVGSIDIRDNDGIIDGTFNNKPYIALTTGVYGENNYSYDFGFYNSACFINISDVTTMECNGDGTLDIHVYFYWTNASIGDNIAVTMNGITKNITAHAVDGESQLMFTLPINLPDFNITVSNTSKSDCSTQTTYNTLRTRLAITSVDVSACLFDPATLSSTSTISVNVTWNNLTAMTDIIKANLDITSQTYLITTTSGSHTFTFTVPADGTTSQEVTVSVSEQCEIVSSVFNAPTACPECIVRIESINAGECSYDVSTGNSSAPLKVEVYWFTPNFPTTINVTANGQTLPITVTTMQGTATVEFLNTPANNGTGLIATAEFTNSTSCNHTITYNAPPPCPQVRDLTLEKSVSPSQLNVGQTAVWTIKVKHQGDLTATGITVKDLIPLGMTYSGVYTASKGTFDGTIWNIGTMTFGEEVTINISTVVSSAGVFYNAAEINGMNERDTDSTPNNGVTSEDDYDVACVSVPYPLCAGDTILAQVKPGSYNITWYKDNVLIPGESASYLTISTPGVYTFTSTSNPGGGLVLPCCCPLEVVSSVCPCELDITDIDIVPCVDDPLATTTDVQVCITWTRTSSSPTLNLNVSGATTGTINEQFIGSANNGNHCFDVNVATNENLTATLTSAGCTQDVQVFTSPAICPVCDVNIVSVSPPGLCSYNASTNTSNFSYSVNVSWSGLVVGQSINLVASGSNILYVVPSSSGTYVFNVVGQATGALQTIVLRQDIAGICSDSRSIQSPQPCGPADCNLIMEVIPGLCVDNVVDILVNTNWTGAKVGDILTVTSGSITQTSAPLTSFNAGNGGSSYLLKMPAPGSGTISATLSGCSVQKPYSVNSCESCQLSVRSITTGRCVYNSQTMRNEFDVTVCVDWANAFKGDVLHAEIGDQILTPTQQGRYYIVDNSSGSHCFTLTALADTYDLDLWVYFNVTGCSVRQTDVVDSPQCCSINVLAQTSICDDNGTPSKATDNKIRATVLVTNENTNLTNYNISIGQGTSVTPMAGIYGAPNTITLGPGTAGGGASFIVTFTDVVNGSACTQTLNIIDPGDCSSSNPTPACPTPKCGTAIINGN
ncbi:MAG TPA: SdrD B-like domain-containing protein [Saprospiraceae bacterium]|mgnify:CR=1 FL=1|jgi:uncharacterized repeat protein (TIGR01451 family)|nr:SdrD B-like domain-containing protein [Saprospiraceae bacterium]